jgi:hypothetical protein
LGTAHRAHAQAAPPAAVAPPPPYPQGAWYPPPPGPIAQERRYWYGWQTLIVDGASVVTAVLVSIPPSHPMLGMPLGGLGLVLGGPIVHWAHGNTEKGFASLAILLATSAVGGAIGVGVSCAARFVEPCSDGEDGWWGRLAGVAVGFPVGAAVGAAIDVSVLAYGTRAEVASPARRVSVLPALDVGRDRVVLGLGGTF